MNRDQLLQMDSHMLLSIVNMKLRDGFNDLNSFCEDIDIEPEVLQEKLINIGYIYTKDFNQFILNEIVCTK